MRCALSDQSVYPNIIWRGGTKAIGERKIASEVPVAISFRGSTQAVLMASPNSLQSLAVGFTITEGIAPSVDAIHGTEVVETDLGFEVRVDLADEYQDNLAKRRRYMAGPVGCGLCGIDSLEQAVRQPPAIVDREFRIRPQEISAGLEAMGSQQRLNHATRAVHAAGFYRPTEGMIALEEDVGRHNAFDKLIGACLLREQFKAGEGAVFVSSRLSVEMVQKAAFFGVPVLIAVSAPTSLALQLAQDIGLTLIAVARGDDFEVFTHPERVSF